MLRLATCLSWRPKEDRSHWLERANEKTSYRPLYTGVYLLCVSRIWKKWTGTLIKVIKTSHNSPYCVRLVDVTSWHIKTFHCQQSQWNKHENAANARPQKAPHLCLWKFPLRLSSSRVPVKWPAIPRHYKNFTITKTRSMALACAKEKCVQTHQTMCFQKWECPKWWVSSRGK